MNIVLLCLVIYILIQLPGKKSGEIQKSNLNGNVGGKNILLADSSGNISLSPDTYDSVVTQVNTNTNDINTNTNNINTNKNNINTNKGDIAAINSSLPLYSKIADADAKYIIQGENIAINAEYGKGIRYTGSEIDGNSIAQLTLNHNDLNPVGGNYNNFNTDTSVPRFVKFAVDANSGKTDKGSYKDEINTTRMQIMKKCNGLQNNGPGIQSGVIPTPDMMNMYNTRAGCVQGQAGPTT